MSDLISLNSALIPTKMSSRSTASYVSIISLTMSLIVSADGNDEIDWSVADGIADSGCTGDADSLANDELSPRGSRTAIKETSVIPGMSRITKTRGSWMAVHPHNQGQVTGLATTAAQPLHFFDPTGISNLTRCSVNMKNP